MLLQHIENESAATIGAVRIPVADSSRFGILEVDDRDRVLSFVEKPERGPEIPGNPGQCLGSMGIYLFETEALLDRLRADAALGDESSHDFGNDIIPKMIGSDPVCAHHFQSVSGSDEAYWRDVGTIDAYYDSNLDLCSVEPQFNLYDENWPTFTLWHNDPPAKTVLDEGDGRQARVSDSLLCPGVVVSGAKVHRSILSNRVFVDENAAVDDSILFRGVVIGKGAQVRRAIIDKWTRVPEGARIGYDRAEDEKRFTVTESGIVVVPRRYAF